MIGETIAQQYRILQELGRGGMGIVYKAEDLRLGRPIALKFLSLRGPLRESDRTRFLREAQAASRINHPNVCVIHEIGDHDGEPFIVMEYVEGSTLAERIPPGGMDPSDVAALAGQIASGLMAAHEQGIIHRDIKPENLMVRDDGRVQIMDFGLAKLRNQPGISLSGQTVGTILYMAPEQVQGSEADVRTDIYSLGVVLYQALSGRLPFDGAHEAAIIYAIVSADPPPVGTLRSGISPELNTLVMKCLSKQPGDRYQSAREVLEALRSCSEYSPGPPRAAKTSHRRPRRPFSRWLLIPASVAAGGCVLWAVLKLSSGPEAHVDSLAILPLNNRGADTTLEYLSDGLTESIISKLSRLSTIKVMSRSSVFHFKGKDIDPQTAGKALGVRAVLAGDVTLRDGQVTISVELLDTRDNTQIWGDQFRRREEKLVDLQEDISKEIVSNLKLRITSDEKERFNHPIAENTAAYTMYLKGRYHWNLRTEADLKESAHLFQESVQQDTGFALAYVGLAQTYGVMTAWGYLDAETGIQLMQANARKALELDDRLGEAHGALAAVLDLQYDREGAIEEYRRAIELNPNDATTCQWYAEDFAALRRFDESFKMIQRAQELDPLSQVIPAVAAVFYANAGQFDRAIDLARQTARIDPQSRMSHLALGLAYTRAGKPIAALPDLEQGVSISDSETTMLSWLGCAYALSGRRSDAEHIARVLNLKATQKYVSPFLRALLATSLGEKDRAFSLLEEGARTHDGWMQQMYEEIMLEPLRGDPRFTDLARRLGFLSQ